MAFYTRCNNNNTDNNTNNNTTHNNTHNNTNNNNNKDDKVVCNAIGLQVSIRLI